MNTNSDQVIYSLSLGAVKENLQLLKFHREELKICAEENHQQRPVESLVAI